MSTRSLHLSHLNVSAQLPSLMSTSSCLPSSFMCSVPGILRCCSMGPFTGKCQGYWNCWTTDQLPRLPLSPNIQLRVPGALLIITIQGRKDTRMGDFLPPSSCNTPAPEKVTLLPTCAPKGPPKLYLRVRS